MEKFVVSARKYRPATFASVVGQKHITSTLKNAIERDQLAHAYLFCGPRGVGKTTCARIFAKAINCLNPNGAEACNECESCRSFNEGRSLNIHELDAASNNSVEDIRNLIEQVRIIPQIGKYSVFIIDEVHMLSQAAFNAFLKTLEEPPQHAIFILATTEKHKIIPTILSRCQIYDFNRIRVEDAVEYLRYIASNEGVSADEESLNLIAQKADGGMRDALSMFDKAVSFCGPKLEYRSVAQTLNVLDYDTYFRFADLLVQGDYVGALLEYDTVLSKGFSGQTFVGGLNQHMRDLLVAKGPAVSLIEYTGSLLERYRQQAAQCGVDFLFGAVTLLSEADGRLRTAANQRLAVELALMKIAALAQKKNNGLNPPPAAEYPLPNLDAAAAVPAGQPHPAQQPVQQSYPHPAQPSPERQPAAQSAQSAQSPAQPPAAAQPAATPAPARKADTAPSPRQASAASAPLMSGQSLTAMLNRIGAAGGEDEAASSYARVDPRSEEKLNAARGQIIAEMSGQRPRFIVAFESISFSGNTVHLVVPSQVLRDELYAVRRDMLESIARTAGVDGELVLEIEIREVEVKMKPLKLEDRLRHFEQNVPLFAKMVKELNLDVE